MADQSTDISLGISAVGPKGDTGPQGPAGISRSDSIKLSAMRGGQLNWIK